MQENKQSKRVIKSDQKDNQKKIKQIVEIYDGEDEAPQTVIRKQIKTEPVYRKALSPFIKKLQNLGLVWDKLNPDEFYVQVHTDKGSCFNLNETGTLLDFFRTRVKEGRPHAAAYILQDLYGVEEKPYGKNTDIYIKMTNIIDKIESQKENSVNSVQSYKSAADIQSFNENIWEVAQQSILNQKVSSSNQQPGLLQLLSPRPLLPKSEFLRSNFYFTFTMRTKSESSKDLSYDTVYYRFEIKVGVNMRINSNNHNENMPYFNFNINDMDIFLENDSKIFKSFLHQCKQNMFAAQIMQEFMEELFKIPGGFAQLSERIQTTQSTLLR